MQRSEIRIVDFSDAVGSEAARTRPAVIVSNDGANSSARRLGRGVITVVPVTSNTERVYPFQVLLSSADTGLDFDLKAQAEQIRSVSVERIGRVIGIVDFEHMARLDNALRLHRPRLIPSVVAVGWVCRSTQARAAGTMIRKALTASPRFTGRSGWGQRFLVLEIVQGLWSGRPDGLGPLSDIRVVIGPVLKSAALISGPIDSQGQERRREVYVGTIFFLETGGGGGDGGC